MFYQDLPLEQQAVIELAALDYKEDTGETPEIVVNKVNQDGSVMFTLKGESEVRIFSMDKEGN